MNVKRIDDCISMIEQQLGVLRQMREECIKMPVDAEVALRSQGVDPIVTPMLLAVGGLTHIRHTLLGMVDDHLEAEKRREVLESFARKDPK